MFFLGLALIARAELVDDFESYEPGLVNDVTADWVAGADNGTSPSTASIVADPVDSANKVIQVTEGGSTSQQWIYRPLASSESIAEGATGTMFFRTRATTEIDSSFGLTEVDAPTTNWGDFRVQFVMHNAVQIRDGGSVRTLAYASTGTQIPWNSDWYNVWLVIDNNLDTVQVYINQTDTDATEADRCVRADLTTQDTFAFRVAAAGALDYVFWRAQNNPNTRLMMVDDINISAGVNLSIPSSVKPYGPEVEQGTPSGVNIPTTLKWKAGADPDGIYEVNPEIVDQYVFLSSGKITDPNLYYIAATGQDPGLTDPNSQFSFTGTLDNTYYWAVVEAIDGYAHNGADRNALTPGVSQLSSVDPNNIIGSTWSYEATKSLPTLTAQPADARVFTTDPSASFTVQFTSAVNPVEVTWFKDDAELVDGAGDVTVVTDPFAYSTLTIATPALADEGKYYCKLSVQEGDDDDIRSVTRLLIIKQLLAKYTFDNSTDRLEDTGDIGAEPGKSPARGKSVAGLAEPNEVLAYVVTLAYVPGIQGDAVYLDGTQYIDLDPNGYPKAGPLDTFGDVRGEGYEKDGFGRGMEEGSILCWVKLQSDGVVTGNANIADGTHYAVSTNGTTSARIIVRGENWNGGWQNLGEANGTYLMDEFSLQDGQWYMFAATWDNSTARIYINGEQVAANTQGYTERYYPWDLSNLIGASRSGQPNRHILNAADFVTGAIDSYRVYNYVISADDIAIEYLTLSGNKPCADHSFVGNEFNFNNTASSYCKVDLGDFAEFAANWLAAGLYETP